jgi:hypothetical protein
VRATDLRDVVGIPETQLADDVVDRLPEPSAPAPWTCRFRAVVWWGLPRRGTSSALPALPQQLRHGTITLVPAGALVRYLDTPVGPYSEVLGGVLLLGRRLPALHVPFLAVDSAASVVGGRVNWALPKTFAEFDGVPAVGACMEARGGGWAVQARAGRRGLPLPAAAAGRVQQIGAGGRRWSSRARVHGLARLVLVDVECAGAESLTGWLPAGRRWGLVVEAGTLTVGRAAVTR